MGCCEKKKPDQLIEKNILSSDHQDTSETLKVKIS